MASGTLPDSESEVLIWKFEFDGARLLDVGNHPHNQRHAHCSTQIREVPCIGPSTLLEENWAVMLNAFPVPEEIKIDILASISRSWSFLCFVWRGDLGVQWGLEPPVGCLPSTGHWQKWA